MTENILAQQVRQAIETENLASFIRENLEGQRLSIRGLAGLCGVDHKSIIKGGDFASKNLAEKLEAKGFEAADLVANGFGPVETWLVIEHFAYDSKAKAPFAKAISRTFGAFGVKSAFSQVTNPTALPSADAAMPIGTITEACDALGKYFGPAYAESALILNLRRHHPMLALPPVQAQDRTSLSSADALLTPTDIARELGLSYGTGNPNPRAANALLKQLGYQVKLSGDWQPTEKGKPFCTRKPVDTNSRSDKSQLMWFSSILGELEGSKAA